MKNINYRKPFEETLAGYYEHGIDTYVVMHPAVKHKVFVSIHERTHLNIGTSTSTGLFQMFLQHLSVKRPYQRFPRFVNSIFRWSCDQSREPHEAAATYAEFCSARHANYIGLTEMELELPEDYKQWLSIFDGFFKQTMPPDASGTVGYHLARFALNTNILTDYAEISDEKIKDFPKYIAADNNSPAKRLRKVLAVIDSYGQARFFKEYIDFYSAHSETLNEAYCDRTYENRKTSFRIQSEILDILTAAVMKLAPRDPIFNEKPIFTSPVPAANILINKWIAFLVNEGYVDKFKFSIEDNDHHAEVDVLDEHKVLVSMRTPQPDLHLLDRKRISMASKSCLAKIWAWDSDEPFVLCERPRRILKKGDRYIRLLPFDNTTVAFFTVTCAPSETKEVLGNYAGAVILDGETYGLVSKELELINEGTPIPLLVLWRNVNAFQKACKLKTIMPYCYFQVPAGDIFMFLTGSGNSIYHGLFAVNAVDISLILDRVSADASRVDLMPFPEELRPALSLLNKFFHFLV